MSSHPLVLVPGLLCDQAVWQPLLAALQQRHTVHIAQHGLADSLPAMAAQILANAPPRFALAGHSMGGRVALEVWAQAPQRVSHLALLDTGFEGLAEGETGERERAGRLRLLQLARTEGMRAMAQDWASGMVHPDRLSEAPLMEVIYDMLARATPEVFAAQIRALLQRPDRSALLASINVPTLVLCGREDSWSTLARHQDMAGRISGSTLVDVPHCGHMCTLEQPDAVSRALLAWLSDEPR